MRLEVPGRSGIIPTWYDKSWEALEQPRGMGMYEKVYKVKIITLDQYITHVEFPSEDEAILFVLRWS